MGSKGFFFFSLQQCFHPGAQSPPHSPTVQIQIKMGQQPGGSSWGPDETSAIKTLTSPLPPLTTRDDFSLLLISVIQFEL